MNTDTTTGQSHRSSVPISICETKWAITKFNAPYPKVTSATKAETLMMNVRLLINRFTKPLISEPKTAKIVEVKATDT